MKKFSRKQSLIDRLVNRHDGKISTYGDLTFVSAISVFPNFPEKKYCLFVWQGRKEDYVFGGGFTEKSAVVNKVALHRIEYDRRQSEKSKKQAERKNKKAAQAGSVSVGDIYYRSWGYDQTNIDYIQVMADKSKFQKIVAPITYTRVRYDGDRVMPCAGETCGDKGVGVITSRGISFLGETYRKWDGNSNYCTHPYNHR